MGMEGIPGRDAGPGGSQGPVFGVIHTPTGPQSVPFTAAQPWESAILENPGPGRPRPWNSRKGPKDLRGRGLQRDAPPHRPLPLRIACARRPAPLNSDCAQRGTCEMTNSLPTRSLMCSPGLGQGAPRLSSWVLASSMLFCVSYAAPSSFGEEPTTNQATQVPARTLLPMSDLLDRTDLHEPRIQMKHPDPGVARLLERFPNSRFVLNTLPTLPDMLSVGPAAVVKLLTEGEEWHEAVGHHCRDLALLLNHHEVADEGAIALALGLAEIEEDSSLLDWSKEHLSSATSLIIWREEERVGQRGEVLVHNQQHLRMTAVLGVPTASGPDLCCAFNGLPLPLRQPLYRVAFDGQSVTDLAKESGWDPAHIRTAISTALYSLQQQCLLKEEVTS